MSPNGGGHHGAGARCDLPDAIVGVGGAGSEAVFGFFRQDWILAEELEHREDDWNPSMQGFVVDIAKDKEADNRVDRINERIQETAEEKFGRGPLDYTTELHAINLAADVPPHYTLADWLMEDDVVADIVEHDRLNAWWLEQNEHLIGDQDHYDIGTVRRRALGKALYHASSAGGDPLSKIVQPDAFDSVTMIVGLGGGTGSGMMIDLARRLNDAHIGVDLVGILPGLDEREETKANAYAALSELEYLSVEGDARNPFRSMTLIPFGPARETLDDMQSFYEQLANVIVAQRNLPGVPQAPNAARGAWPIDTRNLPAYAPFTVVAPQTLRFDVGERQRVKEEFHDWMASRRRGLAAENDVYDALETCIETHFADETPAQALSEAAEEAAPASHHEFNLSEAEAKALRGRLSGLRSLLTNQAVASLEGNATVWADKLSVREEAVRNRLPDDPNEAERDEAIVFALAAVGFDETQPDRDDSALAEYVRDELQTIHRRATLFAVAPTVTDEVFADGIRMALNEDGGYPSDLLSIERELGDRYEELEAAERNVDVLDVLLDEGRAIETNASMLERVDAAKVAWANAARPSVERIVAIDQHHEEIQQLIDDLEVALLRAGEEIERWHTLQERPKDPLDFHSFARLNDLLTKVGVQTVPEQEVRGALREIIMARHHQLEAEAGGLFRYLTDVFHDDEHEDAYSSARDILPGWLSVPSFDATFTVEVDTEWLLDRLDEIDDRRIEAVNEALHAFEYEARDELHDSPVDGALRAAWTGEEPWFFTEPPEEFETCRIRTALEQDFGDVEPATAIDALISDDPADESSINNAVHEVLDGALVEPVREERAQIKSEARQLRTEMDRYEELLDIVQNSDWGRQREEAFPPDISLELTPAADHPYLRSESLASEMPTSANDVAEADLWKKYEERIEDALHLFVQHATSPPLMPLNEQHVASPTGRYSGHCVSTAFMSPALSSGDANDIDVFDDLEQSYRNALSVPSGPSGYRAACLEAGGDWDVSVITFVSGIFLDNIGHVSDRVNGYHTTYNQQQAELMEDIRVRHALGLDGTDCSIAPDAGEGGYVRRDELFDFTQPEDEARFAEESEASIVAAIRNHIESGTFSSTVAVDRDSRQ